MSGAKRDNWRMKRAILVVATGMLLVGQAARAQSPERNVTAYTAADLGGQAATHAGDLVQRLPGFTIIEGDADLRGYAGARGNVLIDGAWPTSKREDIDDILARIPAASVERIELIRGGAGVDMAGHSVLANVIRRHDATAETTIEGGGIASTAGWSGARGQVEHSRKSGETSLDVILQFGADLDDDSGSGVIRTREPGSSLTDIRHLSVRAIESAAEAGAEWRQPLAGGRIIAKGAVRGERAKANTLIFRDATPADREDVRETEELVEVDISARYERAFAERWRLEVLASKRLGWLDALEHADEDGETEQFAEQTDTGETIARIDLSHDALSNLTFSGGVEGALNFLESGARLEVDGAEVVLPGSDVRIDERRIEASFGAVWKPSEKWVLEAGVRFEDSTITQGGDSPLTRDFFYAKPRVSADWAIDASNDLRLAFTREVGQLDFGDFVASASLDTGVVSAGNATLEPEKISRWTATWERRLAGDAALTATWTHDTITDVVDRILVTTPDDQFDAPGNIGDGRTQTLKLELTSPLAGIGMPGGQLKSSILWRSSSVTDPVTGERRRISDDKPVEAFVSLTQDVPALSLTWGMEIDHIGERKTSYRFDEIIRSSEDAGWSVFAEWRIEKQWRLKVEATDLFGRDFNERRTRHDGPRSTTPIEEWQDRDRRTPGYVSVTLRHSMGG